MLEAPVGFSALTALESYQIALLPTYLFAETVPSAPCFKRSAALCPISIISNSPHAGQPAVSLLAPSNHAAGHKPTSTAGSFKRTSIKLYLIKSLLDVLILPEVKALPSGEVSFLAVITKALFPGSPDTGSMVKLPG